MTTDVKTVELKQQPFEALSKDVETREKYGTLRRLFYKKGYLSIKYDIHGNCTLSYVALNCFERLGRFFHLCYSDTHLSLESCEVIRNGIKENPENQKIWDSKQLEKLKNKVGIVIGKGHFKEYEIDPLPEPEPEDVPVARLPPVLIFTD